ncbi:uncharacterized protein RHOBADRAFT_29756 [Rhodotorula graminis WP1]|uniref:DUF221-domain-containing protein n=1 Tax=Rhodotorula graminis (strain WP1) TaxID=578459 RepID=A0A0P9ETR1_RHOGW|nr:uncharacterized protein RHOBADRAFT_29756 [Rhodotorula graminis WP1]KPV72603.1 hypothetical protein RHOBADRAFT_29756 [Rhodotorula graminis WP1]
MSAMEPLMHILTDGNTGLPPDQMYKYQGPWFSTQLVLSLGVGITSFFVFCWIRRYEKFKVLYAPRTMLKGFSPHEVHDHESFFGWVMPTLRTSEFVVLQLVGLDAAVLLSFLRTGFYFFLTCSILAWTVLVPINYHENGTTEGVAPDLNSTLSSLVPSAVSFTTSTLLKPRKHTSLVYVSSHLLFTYLFTILALLFLHRNWRRYIPLRQLFSLELAQSVPARTVMVTSLPPHLRSERALADYFEGLQLGPASTSSSSRGGGGLAVESVVVTRATGSMRELLERRTRALVTLEQAWAKYLGNPDDEEETDGARRDADDDLEARLLSPSRPTIVNPARKRPTLRPHWFAKKVDALDHYAEQFRRADEAVRKRRRGKFRPTGVAFVTFQTIAAAQVAAQVVHYPSAAEFRTELAPEPRDIHWFNLNLSASSVFVRQVLVVVTLLGLLSVWAIPVAALTQLLSWDTIQSIAPRFADLLEKSPRLAGFVQTTLPSLGMVAFNNILPMFLEALSVWQGLPARSWIELSQLKKYHISLLFTTLFVFQITTSTYTLLKDISESPAKVLDKLADTLPKSRYFFVSYVMLSGLAFMPLQLLELGTVIPRVFSQVFLTKTPRDHAELNAPAMVNLGVVYPQALLIWTMGMTYSIIVPLILPFATLYFGLAYLVYKYRFLFVFYRPYESRGQAWPLAFNRVGFGVLLFQVFMLGLFTVGKDFLLVVLMIPLLAGTAYTIWRLGATYAPLARYVNLSQACESGQGTGAEDVVKLRQGHPVTAGQTHLNRGRYGQKGEGVYAVAQNPATDYREPPMSSFYPGILNTGGSTRYGHPALFGALPQPWLPVAAETVKDALVVVDLRRGWRNFKRAAKRGFSGAGSGEDGRARSRNGRGRATSWGSGSEEDPSRAWRGSESSVAASPAPMDEDEEDEDEDDEVDEEGQQTIRYSTFFPHRKGVSARFPPTPPGEASGDDEA